MQNDIELLDVMIHDQADKPAVYRPGPYWIGNQNHTVDAIKRLGLENFRHEPAIGKGFADTNIVDITESWIIDRPKARLKLAIARAPVVRDILAEQVAVTRDYARRANELTTYYYLNRFGDWLEKNQAGDRLADTMHAGCQRFVTVDGQDISQIYIDQAIRVDNFAEHVSLARARTFFELGGGFGTNIHLLVRQLPGLRKIIYVDIPSTLYVATQYLRHFFGDAVTDYRKTRMLDRITFRDDDSLEIICLCPWQIEALDVRPDIFWNAGSMSEMTKEIVQNYADHVIRLLDDDGSICLVLNKPNPSPLTTTPDEVIGCFGDSIQFENPVPILEHENHARYVIGRRRTEKTEQKPA